MLRAALRIARADLAGRPMQTALAALAIFAATAALVVTLALRAGIDDPFADAQQATRGSHVAVYADSQSGDTGALAQLPGVVASDRRHFANGFTSLGGASAVVALETLPAAGAALDVPRLVSGRLPRSAGEALVERSFARETGLEPGARLHVFRGERSVDLGIAGVAVTTEQASYPHWTPGLVWAPEADVRRLGGPSLRTRLAVRLSDPEATSGFIAAAQRTQTARSDLGFTDWHDVRDTLTDQARTNVIIIGVNTLLALIAVGFTVATVIGGRVLAQRREIGLLKAIGLTPRGVTALLVGEYVALGVVAAIPGLLAGAAIAPLLLRPQASLLATPTPSALNPGILIGALLLVLLAIAVFTALPALRGGRLNTVDALALGRAGASRRTSRAARAAAALRLPATARLGVKDAFAGRSRALLTVGALSMMVITVVAGLSMEATYRRVIEDPALRAKPWDVRIEPGALGQPQTLALLRRQPGVTGATTISQFQVQAGPARAEMHARVLGDGFQEFPYAVPDGRMFARPGEAIVGRGLLDALHLKVGDPLTLHLAGQPIRLRIVGRQIEPDNDGEVAIFSRSTLPAALAARVGPGSVIGDLAPGADARALQRRVQRESGNRVAAELVSDEVRTERADVRPIVLGSAALLVAVGIVNLLTTLLLVTLERSRDFAIFKAVGMTPRGILAVVNAGGAVLGLVAIMVGIPAGIVIFRTLMTLMSPSGGADIVGTPSLLWLALVVPFVLVVTAAANSLPARRAARVSAATVLRAE